MTNRFDQFVAKCDQAIWQAAHDAIKFNDNDQGKMLKGMKYRDLPAAVLSKRQADLRRVLIAIIPTMCDELTTRSLEFVEWLEKSPEDSYEDKDPLEFFEQLIEGFKTEAEFS